jgi:predicted nucleic acid-binding protein
LSRELLYLDSSAIVKLIRPEPETDSLVNRLATRQPVTSSVVARVEVRRAVRRLGDKAASRQAEEVLGRIALIRLDDAIVEEASVLDPPELRSLDAIHLATAISLRENLDALITYDRGLSRATQHTGVQAESPK